MRLRRPARGMAAVIPTASMADIAFLLVIFFMVTTAYSLDRTPMDLPETKEQDESKKGSAVISITAEETFRFSAGEEDTHVVNGIEGLADSIRTVASGNSMHPFVIKADRRVKYRVIDQVLEQLRLAGAQNITLLSRGQGLP